MEDLEDEIIKVDDENIYLAQVIHKCKSIQLYIRENTTNIVLKNPDVQVLINKYKKQRYRTFIFVEGKGDIRDFVEKMLKNEFDRLKETNARDYTLAFLLRQVEGYYHFLKNFVW